MSTPVRHGLHKLLRGEDLTEEEMAAIMEELVAGRVSEPLAAALLVALRMKGETADELVGAARTLRRHMRSVRHSGEFVVDTCGTGGDALHTFNISTAAALVVAACGVPVAKHGNRGVSSRSGSADVLRQLGVNLELDVAAIEECLRRVGIAFCFAPLLHPAMRHVQPVRRELGIRTLFNFLGPLLNPAGAHYQLLGVGDPSMQSTVAHAVARLGCKRVWVVRGAEGLDEVSPTGPTRVFDVADGVVTEFEIKPEDFGLEPCPLADLVVNSVAESAEMIESVLRGAPGAARTAVLINAAATLLLVGQATDPAQATARAAAALDQGHALAKLEQLIRVTNELADSAAS